MNLTQDELTACHLTLTPNCMPSIVRKTGANAFCYSPCPRVKGGSFSRTFVRHRPVRTSPGIANTSLTNRSTPSPLAAVPAKNHRLNHAKRLWASCANKTTASWAKKLFFLLFYIPKPRFSPFMSASIPARPS
jgi:hypothetical protein